MKFWDGNRVLKDSFILGCSGIAGLYDAVEEETAIQAFCEAISSGVIAVDTAPHYGLGLSEERIKVCSINLCILNRALGNGIAFFNE